MALMFLNQVAWAFVHESILAEPEGPVAIRFWLGQMLFAIFFCFGCVVGFKPALTLTCTQTAIRIQDGDSDTIIPYRDIQAVEDIGGRMFHRHFRRYINSRVFVNRIEDELLLLHTADGPVVLGLAVGDLKACKTYLETQFVQEPPVLNLESAQVA
jgi:hypothetical protein